MLALALLAPTGALAQEEGGPLRFLKPWLDRQLRGEETAPQGAIEPGATPDTAVAPAPSAEPADAAATPEAAVAPAPPSAERTPAEAADSAPAPDHDAAVAAKPPVDASEPAAAPSAVAAEPGESAMPDPKSGERTPPAAVPLRFAVLAGRDVSATMRALGPMADELQRAVGRPVEIQPMSSYAAMIDAQTERRVDGGFHSAASFAEAQARCDCLEPLVAPKAGDATLAFHALIVSPSDSGIDSPADLEGKVVAMGASDSIGARRMQLAGLLEASIDPATFFDAVIETESAEAALRAMMSGSADAAFAWSSLAGDAKSGYSRGTLADLVAAGEISMDEIAIVWRSPPIAHGPFAVLSTLPDADKAKIASYLSTLYARNPAAYDVLNPLYAGGYSAVDARDYSGLAALTTMNVDAVMLPGAPPRAESMPPAPE